MHEEFHTYRHGEAGFMLPVPASWEVTENVQGCAFVAVEPVSEHRYFAANIVVTVERLQAGESMDAWMQRARSDLAQSLNRLWTIDTEDTEIDGLPAWRVLTHYLHSGGGVNLEQWSVARGEWGYVVSCSMSALDYDRLADVMAHTAEGLRIEGVAA